MKDLLVAANLLYSSVMPRQQKSPQQKKQLELKKDHFTFTDAPHAFRKNWKKKKANVNRQYRRRSDEVLCIAKPEISGEDAEVLVGDVTVAHLENSISERRVRKRSTVSLGEKIKTKSLNRQERIGRRVESKRESSHVVQSAVSTLVALDGEELVQVVNRIDKVLHGGDPIEWMRLYQSKDRIDRAILFVEQIERGDWTLSEALRTDQKLCKTFQSWAVKASRILAKQARPSQRKLAQKVAIKKKVNILIRQNRKN